MDKQVLVKHIRWKDSNITEAIHQEVLCLVQWKKFSNLFKCNRTRILLLWSGQVICKFTTRLFLIC